MSEHPITVTVAYGNTILHALTRLLPDNKYVISQTIDHRIGGDIGNVSECS